MKIINVEISEKQDQKIRKSGLSYQDYVSHSIDFYDQRKLISLHYSKMNIIQECIDKLEKLKNDE